MTKRMTFYSIYEDAFYTGTMTALLNLYGFTDVKTPEEADILVFNGGSDIATEIYNERPVFRGIPPKMTFRDEHEVGLFNEFKGKKFMLGICRGAQLLNCLNGGSLWQHVTDHYHDHKMIDLTTGNTIQVTSTHHQMMRPTKDAEIIGVSNICTYRQCEDRDEAILPNKDMREGADIEVVWYPDTRSLCIQGHPEYVPGTEFADWSVELLVKKYREDGRVLAA